MKAPSTDSAKVRVIKKVPHARCVRYPGGMFQIMRGTTGTSISWGMTRDKAWANSAKALGV